MDFLKQLRGSDKDPSEVLDDFDKAETEKDLFASIKSKVEDIRGSSVRIAWESNTMNNIAYLCGTDSMYNWRTKTFQVSSNTDSTSVNRKKFHINKILPTIQNRLSRLAKSPPKFDVMPESNDTENKEAARLATETLETLWLKMGLNEKRIPLYMWMQQAGFAYVKVCWDPTLGKLIQDPMTGEATWEGDIRAEVVSPFELFVDPLAKTWDDVLRSWCIQCKVRPLQYFKDRYERGAEVKEEDCWLVSLQYDQKIQGLSSYKPGSGSLKPVKNSAIEMVKYQAPSKEYPEGRMIICANGIILEDKELPCGKIPFAKFDDIIIGGKFHSEAIITALRPLQDQKNEIVRRTSEWVRRLLAGKYTAARGCGLKREQLNNEQAEILFYDAVPNAPNGGRPEALAIPAVPQYVYKEEEMIDAAFNDISGIGEVSRGQISASMPAIGMQLLQEQDQSRIGVVVSQNEPGWAYIGHLILEYVKDYYVMPRKLKMAGRDRSYMVKDISGEMLKGNTDVIVIPGSTMPGSKTLHRQDILNTYTQGLMGDPADPKVRQKVLELIEFGDTEGIWDDYSLDTNQIARGLEQLEQGMPVEVSEFDNHALWIEKLNKTRKDEKFQSFDPMIQALFIQTMEQHIQFLATQSGAMPPPPVPADLMNPVSQDEALQAQGGLPHEEAIPAPPSA